MGAQVALTCKQIYSESLQVEPNLDRSYTFPIDMAPNQSETCNYDPKLGLI